VLLLVLVIVLVIVLVLVIVIVLVLVIEKPVRHHLEPLLIRVLKKDRLNKAPISCFLF
jgi:hypothetical protein